MSEHVCSAAIAITICQVRNYWEETCRGHPSWLSSSLSHKGPCFLRVPWCFRVLVSSGCLCTEQVWWSMKRVALRLRRRRHQTKGLRPGVADSLCIAFRSALSVSTMIMHIAICWYTEARLRNYVRHLPCFHRLRISRAICWAAFSVDSGAVVVANWLVNPLKPSRRSIDTDIFELARLCTVKEVCCPASADPEQLGEIQILESFAHEQSNWN